MRVCVLLLFLLTINLYALEEKSFSGDTNVLTSPIINPNNIIFIATNKAKSIKVLLESENWKPMDMVYDDRARIWYYIYEKELPKGRYRYKLLIDGFITTDPLNRNRERDKIGGYFSFFELREGIEVYRGNPVHLGGGYYEFRYKDLKASKVVLVGSFNNWSPYELEMERGYGGMWKVRIYLPKGEHYYYFIVDDQITPDPLNTMTVKDKHGNIINVVDTTKLN
ncbi:MAG: hypothetical protein ACK4F9_04130 [Brevinematia bacterium]